MPIVDVPEALHAHILRLVLDHLEHTDHAHPAGASSSGAIADADMGAANADHADSGDEPNQSRWRPYTVAELVAYDVTTNKVDRRYRALLDHLCQRPGKENALSRPEMASVMECTVDSTDAVMREISKKTRRLGRNDPPARWAYGDTIEPEWKRLSYRFMLEDDAAAWRELRGL